MIPSIAVLELRSLHWRTPRLWLPLFLLWIPVILLSPLVFIVIYGLCIVGRISPWRAIAACWAFLCGLRGLHVHVSSNCNKVLIRIL